MATSEAMNPQTAERDLEQRVLIAAPTGCDAEVLCRILSAIGIETIVCTGIEELCRQIEKTATAVILAEEVLTPRSQELLAEALSKQPEWSDVPLIVMAADGDIHPQSRRSLEEFDALGHAVLLQRPVRGVTLLSSVRAAIQSRARQYQVRDELVHRKRAEQALRESEEQYRRLVGLLPVAVYSCEAPSGVIAFYNEEAARLWGRAPKLGDTDERFCGSFKLWLPEGSRLPHDQTPMAVALREGRQFRNQDLVIERPDGTRINVLVNIDPVRDADGRVVGAINAFHDITARKQAEQALRESEERFARFMQHLPGLAWIKDAQGRYVYANDAAEKAFRMSRDRLYGQTDEDIFPPEIASQFRENDRRALEGETGTQVVETLEHEDGTLHHSLVSKFPIPGGDGHRTLVGGMAVDITDRKLAVEALRESEERLHLALEAGRMGSWEWSLETNRVVWSPGLEAIHGLQPGTFGGTFEDYRRDVHPDDREKVASATQHALETGAGFQIEYRIIWPDESLHWVEGRGMVFRNESGQPVRMVGICADITDRKRAEAALKAREAELDLVAKTTPLILTRCSRDLRYLFVNRAAAALFGLSPDQVIGRPITDIMGEKAFSLIRPRVEQVLRGEPVEYEEEIPYAAAGLRWMRVNYLPDTDEHGTVHGWVASIFDITDLKRAEKSLQVRARQQLTVAQLGELALRGRTPQRVFEYTTATVAETLEVEYCKVLELLPGGAELLLRAGVGWKEGLVGKAKIDTGLDSQAGYTLVSDAPVVVVDLREEKRFSGPPLLVEHRVVSGMSCIIRGVDGKPWGVLGAHSTRRVEFTKDDVSFLLAVANILGDAIQRERGEQALRESEERFRTLADNMSQFAWMADAKGWLFWYNQRWYDYTGTTLEEMQGWGWKKLHHPDHVQRVVERVQHSWDTGEPWEDIFPLRGKDGNYRWFLSRALPIRDAAGNVIRWFGTNTDVTEQRAAEEALREADHRKDEFLATLAHELRDPLAPIRNTLELLKRSAGDEHAIRQAHQAIERQITHMVRLIDDLLDVSRITRDKLVLHKQRVELGSVIHQAIEIARPLAESKHQIFQVSLPERPIHLDADPVRVAQVFGNLLNNACKYTPWAGTIWLTLRQDNNEVVVSLKDDGVGISPEHLEGIFEMFVQVDRSLERSQGGLGIGLTLAKRLLELHGGSITAHSEGLGQGSEFVVRLPALVETPTKRMSVTTTEAEAVVEPSRILVVDDNRASAVSLAELLKLSGHQTHVAHDGPGAADAAAALRPDVILLDIGLPGMNGYDVCRTIREQPWGKNIIVIAVTGWGQDEDRRKTRQAGFNGHLVKPIDYDVLIRLLADLRPARNPEGHGSERGCSDQP